VVALVGQRDPGSQVSDLLPAQGLLLHRHDHDLDPPGGESPGGSCQIGILANLKLANITTYQLANPI